RLTRISETLGSLSRGSSGPNPKISSRISRARRSRSAKLSGTASLFTVFRISSRTSSRAASLGVRPNFSRSRRSRILRWRSALTCWYSVLSKVCKFAIPSNLTLAQPERRLASNRLEQRPGFAFYINVVLGQDSRQPGKILGHLAIGLLHKRNSAIDGRGHCEILIGNLPQKLGSRSGLGIGFTETRDLAEAVQHQAHPLPASGLAEVLLDPGRAPQGRNIRMGHQQYSFRKIANQARGRIHARRHIHHN